MEYKDMKTKENKILVKYNIDCINSYIKTNKITREEFCKRCKISPYLLNKIYNNENCKITPVLKILKFLNISAFELLGF